MKFEFFFLNNSHSVRRVNSLFTSFTLIIRSILLETTNIISEPIYYPILPHYTLDKQYVTLLTQLSK